MDACVPDAAGWLLDEFDADRFWGNVRFRGGQPYSDDPLVDRQKVTGGCWLWGSGDDLNVYGRFSLLGKWHAAHRIAFRDFGNSLPDGLDIDHLCRIHRCVRPEHLEAVTASVNMQRGAHTILNRAQCKHGHDLTPENITYRRRGDRQVRSCRTCLNESARRTHARRMAKRAI